MIEGRHSLIISGRQLRTSFLIVSVRFELQLALDFELEFRIKFFSMTHLGQIHGHCLQNYLSFLVLQFPIPAHTVCHHIKQLFEIHCIQCESGFD